MTWRDDKFLYVCFDEMKAKVFKEETENKDSFCFYEAA